MDREEKLAYCEEGGWINFIEADPFDDVKHWKFLKVGENLVELELAGGKWAGRNVYTNNGDRGSCEMRDSCSNTELWRRQWVVKNVDGEDDNCITLELQNGFQFYRQEQEDSDAKTGTALPGEGNNTSPEQRYIFYKVI